VVAWQWIAGIHHGPSQTGAADPPGVCFWVACGEWWMWTYNVVHVCWAPLPLPRLNQIVVLVPCSSDGSDPGDCE
jgi:hypothetical protein